jgi:hypothetical protein
MNKDTIELERFKKHWKGYGLLFNKYESSNPDNLSEVLDKLVEWSKENPNKKIYKHKLLVRNEDVGDGLAYDSKTQKWSNRINGDGPKYEQDIPFVDLVYYLDIYWQ